MRILTQVPILVQPLNVKKKKRGKIVQIIRLGRIVITIRQTKSGEYFQEIEEPP